MRAILWLVAALAVIWTGYWFVGARQVRHSTEDWFATQTEAGLTAGYEAASVSGFPGRFDLNLTAPHLADPVSLIGWAAPDLTVTALAYNPWHLIAVYPATQTVTLPDQTLTLATDKLLASLVMKPGLALQLDRTRVAGDKLDITSSLGWRLAAESLHFATKAIAADGTQHEIGLEILGITPDSALRAMVPDLPDSLDQVHLDALVTFTSPVTLAADGAQPGVVSVVLKDLNLAWGDLALAGTGSVTADALNQADGRIDLKLHNWRKAMPLLVAAGYVTPQVAPTWEKMLDYLARQSGGDPETLDLPLVFAGGRASLGPLPLGAAPTLR